MATDRRKMIWIAAAVVLALAVGVMAGSHAKAARARGAWMGGPDHRLAFVRTALDLSDAQAAQIREIMLARHEAARPMQLELNQQAERLLELTERQPQDVQATRETIDRISALTAQLVRLHLEGVLEARATLTPQQQQKADRFIRIALERHRERQAQQAEQ